MSPLDEVSDTPESRALETFHHSLTVRLLDEAQTARRQFFGRYGWWPVVTLKVATSGVGTDGADLDGTPNRPPTAPPEPTPLETHG